MKQFYFAVLFLVSIHIYSEDYSYDWFFSHTGINNELFAPGISDPGMSDSAAAFRQAEFRAKTLLALMHCSFVGDLTTINMGNANSGYTGTETDIEIIHTSKIIARLPDSCGIEITENGYTQNDEAMVLARLIYNAPDSIRTENVDLQITRYTGLTPTSPFNPEHSDDMVFEAQNVSGTILYKYTIDLKRKEVQTIMEDSQSKIQRRLVYGNCQFDSKKGRAVYGNSKGRFAINCEANIGNGLWSAIMENIVQGISMATSLMESSHSLLVSSGIQNTDIGHGSVSNTEYLQSAKNYSLNKVSPSIVGIELEKNILKTNISIIELNGGRLPRKPTTGNLTHEMENFHEEMEDNGWLDYYGREMDGVTGAIWEYLQRSDEYVSANNTIAASNMNTALLMSLEMSKLKLANNFNAQRYMLTNTNASAEEVSTTNSAKALTKASLDGIYPFYFLKRPLSNGYIQIRSYIFLNTGKLTAQ